MSIVALSWVLRNSEATLGNRLTLIALAEFAHDDGSEARPSIQTLMERTRLSQRSVQYALRSLEKEGAIEKIGVSSRGCNVYRVVMDQGADSAPPGGAIHDNGGVQPTAPDPSLEPLQASTPPVVPPFKHWTVDRKPVTPGEESTAQEILFYWNHHAGQKLASKEWLAKIIMRIREQPDLSLQDHEAVIARVLNDPNPWWRGPASPSIIYGSGAQFERSILAATQTAAEAVARDPKRYGRGMTTAQILAATRETE